MLRKDQCQSTIVKYAEQHSMVNVMCQFQGMLNALSRAQRLPEQWCIISQRFHQLEP